MLRFSTIILLVAAASTTLAQDLPPSCEKPIYCNSDLLHRIQLAHLYNDSKTFVDFRHLQDEATTLAAFDNLVNAANGEPTTEQLKAFVAEYFAAGDELEDWSPTDYTDKPKYVKLIRDANLKQFALDINAIWPTLGRKVKQEVIDNPDKYSFIPVTHGFVIPGGRFSELYYWDTYWIIEGLLISGMKETAKGVIENLIELLKKLGHIPNGSRWYYQERSQPPLLISMVSLYLRETKDLAFLRNNIDLLESELNYWLDTQVVSFQKDGKTYSQLHYYAPSEGPRPESYSEDYESAINYSEDRKTQFYVDIKSAAESGWDFSSRWFIGQDGYNNGNLTTIQTRYIIPVDLNSIFASSLQKMAYFRALLNDPRKGAQWAYLAKQWRDTIEEVLWNENAGTWFDYDILNNKHREYFYPSNIAPLWMGAVDKRLIVKHSHKLIKYLVNSHGLDYPGGVPTSLIRSGEQWDFPNSWPPLVSITVNALEAIGTREARHLAFDVAQTWIRANYKGFTENQQMFEKYDAENPGKVGGGGEYIVQAGFGWSNGVVIEFLAKYGRTLTLSDEAVIGLSADSEVASDAAIGANGKYTDLQSSHNKTYVESRLI